ncbi:hypothetical protein DFH09DRAFT_1096008 [Mycena vulgaris]|nr:hypothetical protein DFH09DRAFT_1096008 [Mycena vulgaris]
MSTGEKKHPLILPPPVEGINVDLAHQELSNDIPIFSIAQPMTDTDEDGEPDPHILIDLGRTSLAPSQDTATMMKISMQPDIEPVREGIGCYEGMAVSFSLTALCHRKKLYAFGKLDEA